MMKKQFRERLRKVTAISLSAICLILGASTNCYAADNDSASVTETYDVMQMSNGSDVIEIPVVKRNVSKARSGIVESTVHILVPDMTDETMEKNEQYVQQIKETGRFSTPCRTVGTGDFMVPGYIVYTSTLNYSVSYYQGYFRLYDLISFKLDREIYTMAPFARLHNATAKVLQVGTIGDPGDPAVLTAQEKEFGTIQYGTSYTLPTYWVPVGPVDGGQKIGVDYKVKIEYANGDRDTLPYFHEAI